MKYQHRIFADYYTVYLVDEGMEWYHPDMWSETVYDNERVAVAPGVIGISTARNMTVPVEVEILESEPQEPSEGWDQVVDCSIEIQSGKLAIGGPGLDDDAPSTQIKPATY